MRPRAITVSQLNNYIKQVFDAEELLHNVEVVGDIDGIRQSGSAVFFTLKDAAATIPCVCYIPAKLKGIANGSNVVVRGTVSYWHKAGKISFVVSSVESFGFGALFLKFEELKAKLQAEGFMEAGVKKALPSAVKRVGVVTSKTGAVLHDIVKVAGRRNSSVSIVLYPTAVQGTGAEAQIEKGIRYFSSASDTERKVDVVIVARGGGSAEDLAAFNSECVARAVFESPVPIVSAVGHETDWTLIDFIADLRAPTPSAAAELAVPEYVAARTAAVRAAKHLKFTVLHKYQNVLQTIAANYELQRRGVVSAVSRLSVRTAGSYAELKNITNAQVAAFERVHYSIAAYIESNNPLAVLKRGYAKVFKDGEAAAADVLKAGDSIDVRFYNGTVNATVN